MRRQLPCSGAAVTLNFDPLRPAALRKGGRGMVSDCGCGGREVVRSGIKISETGLISSFHGRCIQPPPPPTPSFSLPPPPPPVPPLQRHNPLTVCACMHTHTHTHTVTFSLVTTKQSVTLLNHMECYRPVYFYAFGVKCTL